MLLQFQCFFMFLLIFYLTNARVCLSTSLLPHGDSALVILKLILSASYILDVSFVSSPLLSPRSFSSSL